SDPDLHATLVPLPRQRASRLDLLGREGFPERIDYQGRQKRRQILVVRQVPELVIHYRHHVWGYPAVCVRFVSEVPFVFAYNCSCWFRKVRWARAAFPCLL